MNNIRVALDAMGGEFAPEREVHAALAAIKRDVNLHVVLVGQSDKIREFLPDGEPPSNLSILHADDVVGMADEPSTIVKNRKASSLYVGVDLMRQGEVDAFVSAGNTGGVMATATMVCGRLRGVSRPTIGSFFPTERGEPTLVADVGANVDSKPRFLYDYAVMGSVYAELILGRQNPTVGLLNVGEESSKGTETAKEAFALLSNSDLNFVGNVEGRDILKGSVDVVVCDGFEGNIVLKFAESVIGFLKSRFKQYAERSLLNKLIVGAFRPVLRKVLSGMDYQEYGGVPLLGINGVAIIGHGSSTAAALENMIHRAAEVVRLDVNGKIQAALENDQVKSRE